MAQTIHCNRRLNQFGSLPRLVMLGTAIFFTACSGSDTDPAPNTPLSTPMALVVNQGDTTMTTLRLDGKGAPLISTLSLGPTQVDAIGGVAFSLGEWIFATNTNTNKVAAIDPIGGLEPILEEFLEVNGPVRLGMRPTRIYRDPVDKEVLWTMNAGDPATGIDTLRGCRGGSVSILHNSHLSAGGEKPRVSSTVCLSGAGTQFITFSIPPAVSQEIAFVSSQTTGIISPLLADSSFGEVRWSEVPGAWIDLCDSAKETSLGHPVCDADPLTPNHSGPSGMYWSKITGKIYSHLAGYRSVVEIDPVSLKPTPRRIDVPSAWSVEMTPNGRFLFLAGEDIASDLAKVIGKFGLVDLTQPTLTFVGHSVDHVRPSQFRFTADGNRLYVTQLNVTIGLTPQQAASLKKDKLYAFDTTPWPASFPLLTSVDLPSVGPLGVHGLDVWVTGQKGAGSAKGVVVTNALHNGNGSVSLIDAATNAITATIPVGRNPTQVTVYYPGLAASDNQATPTW
ncbi:MAG: hypothetical protein KF693_10750 [Nitrospira sp.]|nr:hypothetical protein [Nitrospira sp.]